MSRKGSPGGAVGSRFNGTEGKPTSYQRIKVRLKEGVTLFNLEKVCGTRVPFVSVTSCSTCFKQYVISPHPSAPWWTKEGQETAVDVEDEDGVKDLTRDIYEQDMANSVDGKND
ncbi:hypothetical protein JRQ81_012939 [Phrynocephalus forsythii]|uniref:Uncharacterized protein n=1 Tax=Phrynocephalus forsythii TaxID=171643 RepID=A0A9Q1B3K4_9SAUR|nr:hypothetical protein JRQ81_012939 [Phrynocephalus forsythii]